MSEPEQDSYQTVGDVRTPKQMIVQAFFLLRGRTVENNARLVSFSCGKL